MESHSARPSDALFSSLVREHEKRLYRFVRATSEVPSDVEVVAQHAFVEAYRTAESFRGHLERSTWLFGTAMNLVKNSLSCAPHRARDCESDKVLDTRSDGPEALLQRDQVMTSCRAESIACRRYCGRYSFLLWSTGVQVKKPRPCSTSRAREIIKASMPRLREAHAEP